MDNQEEEEIKKMEAKKKAMESTQYMKVIRRKNNCGTWELTSGATAKQNKEMQLKWFIVKLYLKNDPTYM